MRVFLITILSAFLTIVSAQTAVTTPHCADKKFHKQVDRYTDDDFPVLDVEQVKEGEYQTLDAREKEEYLVSHIPGARWVGYDDFLLQRVEDIKIDEPIAVYCSIGYRSERIAKKLKKAGYTNVYNVYGSLFEWANRGYILENENGETTKQIHSYNKDWSKWVLHPELKVVW